MSEYVPAENRTARYLAFRTGWKGTLVDLVVLALSGCYFTLSFPGIDAVLPAWSALIPLLALCIGRSPLRAFFYGLTFSYFWNLTGCFFLREIMIFIPFIFGIVLGVFTGFFAAGVPFICRNILYPVKVQMAGCRGMAKYCFFPFWRELLCVVALSAWWVVIEWIRSWIFTGFPWNLVSTTQWDNAPFIQICEYTGIYGVSFLVVLFNFAAYFGIRKVFYAIREKKLQIPWVFCCACLLCLLNYIGGSMWMPHRERQLAQEDIRLSAIGVVQPHLSQRRAGTNVMTLEALEQCAALTTQLHQREKAGKQDVPLEVIAWPESAVPHPYYAMTELGNAYRQRVRGLLSESNVPIILGTITAGDFVPPSQYNLYNSALMLKHGYPVNLRDMQYDAAGCYNKVHLVPYGEFIPLNDQFPVLGRMVGMGRNLTPGKGFYPLDVGKMRIGVLICYEDVFPYTARKQALSGSNVLLVITNDAWYPTSFEPVQHYANSVFRTVETRLPMVRCGNSDYSVLIDALGRTVDSVHRKGSSEPDPGLKKAGSTKFTVPVPLNHKMTFYTRYGNVFVFFCIILTIAGFGFALYQKYQFRKAFAQTLVNPPLE